MINKLSDLDAAEVRRATRTRVSEWEAGRLSAWLISVADYEQRTEIERALAFQVEGKS